MIRPMKLLLTIVALVLIFGQAIHAMPLTYYQYVTNFELTVFNDRIWFWSSDTLDGPVHSNDFIKIKHAPQFYGQVSTSQANFILDQPSPHFEFEPIFNAPPVEFPQDLSNIRGCATPWIPSQNGHKITWIRMLGDQGIDIFQYPAGTPRNDSLYEHLRPPQPDQRLMMFIDGDVEVEGTLVGQLTIGCSGNMYLLDDCVYEGAGPFGQFDEDEMTHKLGLASEQNIFIRNTIRNGRNNGLDGNWDDLDRHSIVITAALVALNESFTFEQQNDDWDRYQGPEPDERGFVYLKGSLAQYRRGYVHRRNHEGTGYYKSYKYDHRFTEDGPPGFGSDDYGVIYGRHERLVLRDHRRYSISNADIGSLIVYPGIEIILGGLQPLVVRDSLIMQGTDDQPININPGRRENRTLFQVEGGARSYVELKNVIFGESLETRFACDSMKVANCQFNAPATWEGIIQVSGSKFADEAYMTSWHQLLVLHNVFENGLTIAGYTRDGHIINNTFVGGRRFGLRLRRFRNLEVENNIFAFNQEGIRNLHNDELQINYNNVFGNDDYDYIDCSPGEGTISIDPGFVDLRRGDYHLTEGSPCIDAGNPNSPRDPDGTRADIGAFYFPQPNSVPDDFAPTNAEAFELTGVYPNPFNSTTTIGYYLPVKSNVLIRVFDLTGRLQAILVDTETNAGSHKIEWNLKSQSAGMYLVQMQAGEFSSVMKIMLLK